jgi:hypothetical protein
MSININFRFSSDTAEAFFNCSKRNILWVSGYGAGKTYAACQKALALMCKFPGYRVAIGRYSGVELKRTTMQTFFKVCPPELYAEEHGGKRVDSLGYVDLINGSRVYWMHFDQYDESALRSLEINMAIVDQAEEIMESVYLTLDSRVGRWDALEVPDDIREYCPVNKFTGRRMAPAYTILLANPPDEGIFSYLYTRFHPNSDTVDKDTHAYFQSDSRDNAALPEEIIATYLTRDEEWINRYVKGEFTQGAGSIHSVPQESILEVDEEWVRQNLLKKATLFRVLDHGSSAPTCCTWWATLKGQHYCYREYYMPDRLISDHRKNIADLSGDESYSLSIADPAIFKKTFEKYGGFWSIADEYRDATIDAPPVNFIPADNNEFATRNRINELFRKSPAFRHPLTGEEGAPAVYFIKRTSQYPQGCHHIISETNSQKKKLLAEINGKKIYSDDREDSIADHAYDTFRYFAAMHLSQRASAKPKARPNSFIAFQNRIKAHKLLANKDRYGMAFK